MDQLIQVILIAGGIILVLVIIIVFLLLKKSPEIPLKSSTNTPENTLTSVASVINPIDIAATLAITMEPKTAVVTQPTFTPEPTYTSTTTPTPTFTPTLTFTPIPTSPPPGTVLFEDNFDNGLSQQWETLSGDPETPKGYLTGKGRTWLSVGDVGWKDIKIEFSALSPAYCGGDSATPPLIGVRASDWYNFVAFHFGNCYKNIYKVIDGNYEEIPNSKGLVLGKPTWQKVIVMVEARKFTLLIDGQISTYYSTDKFPFGRIVLSIDDYTSIDNFKITAIP